MIEAMPTYTNNNTNNNNRRYQYIKIKHTKEKFKLHFKTNIKFQ